jgi:RNA polymerase-binding transcription factor DksA
LSEPASLESGRSKRPAEANMNKARLNHFRKRLQEYAARAQSVASGLEEQSRQTTGEGAGDLSSAPMHLGDVGTEVYLQEMNATLLEHEEHVTREIRDALARIDAGTFGICENCDKKIPLGRLDAVPYARYCVACADKIGDEAAANLNAGRPGAPRGSQSARRQRKATGGTSDVGLLDGDRLPVADLEPPEEKPDIHAAGTAGGGTAVGGLAGTNIGDGAPSGAGLEDAMGSGNFDAEEADAEDNDAYAGASGGAVGGTPAGKRARGGRARRGIAPQPEPGNSPTGP